MNEQFKDISVTPLRSEPASFQFRHYSIPLRYGLAVFYSLSGLAVLLLVQMHFSENEPPLILLALCVTLTAWQGGFGPGFVSTLLVTAGSWGLIIPPEGFAMPHPTQVVRLFLIVASGSAVSWLAERLHRALDLLQNSERRLRVVLDNAALGIIEFDRDDHIILANRHALKLLSYPLNNLLGKSLRDVTLPADHPLADDIARKLHDGSLAIADYKARYVRFCGTPLSVHSTVAPIRDRNGQFLGSIGTIEDISDRIKNETERERLLDNLARSNRDLEQFANIVSHDLQEPLRMVEAFGDLLKQRHAEKLDDEGREYLDFITAGASRMSMLIKGLLAFSRLDRESLVKTPTNLNDILRDVLGNLRMAIESSRTRIKAASMPEVSGSPTQLLQLFQNLIENAIKYRKPDVAPEITIVVEKRDGFWLFSVTDNGLGIDAAHHTRIFELFQRLQTEDDISGSGIGLAVCKKIVERHGGGICVESTPGRGSTFLFTLPCSS
jgi:PAS domain S-box-containing protein